jgi:membrane-bound metal-dependent hydrolase YbcI (DUF457 family)
MGRRDRLPGGGRPDHALTLPGMFLGHIALGLAAKRITPRVSLAMLLAASLWADTVWPVFILLGLEEVRIEPGNTAFTPLNFVSYPYSHSLAMLAVWALLVGGAYRAVAGGRRTVWVLGSLVLSHWLLDYITHRPDMPLYPGSARYGLGLWNSIPGTVAIELAMYSAGLAIYGMTTRARDAVGRWGYIVLQAVLVASYVAAVTSPPPPNTTAIAVAAIAGTALFTAWAWWVDKHRELK